MISFSAITQAQYDALSGEFIQDRIYYITDTGKQYLNGVEYGSADLSGYATETYVNSEVSGKADASALEDYQLKLTAENKLDYSLLSRSPKNSALHF